MVRWAKLLPGVLVLVVAGAFLVLSSAPQSVGSGGFIVDGRQCLYRVVDSRLEYLIVLGRLEQVVRDFTEVRLFFGRN